MATRTQDSTAGVTGAALVTVLGGVAALVGSLLAWIQVGGGGALARFGAQRSLDVRGTALLSGKVALAAGIVLVLTGAGLWIARGGEARRLVAVVSVVAAAVIIGVAIAAFQNEALALLRQAVSGLARTKARAPRLAGGGALQALTPSHGPGLYLALTGGIVALAGSVASVFWTTDPVDAPPARSANQSGTAPPQPFSKGRAA
jgi:hypothetical protein